MYLPTKSMGMSQLGHRIGLHPRVWSLEKRGGCCGGGGSYVTLSVLGADDVVGGKKKGKRRVWMGPRLVPMASRLS
jgi:hypothetical protein